MLRARIFLPAALALTLGSCPRPANNGNGSSNANSSNSNAPASPGLSRSISIDRSLDDRRVTPPHTPEGKCPPSSFDLKSQAVRGNGTATLGDRGPTAELADGIQVITVVVPAGHYSGTVQPLDPFCNKGPAPTPAPLGTLEIDFNMTYRAQVDVSNPAAVCVFKSRVDFSSFVARGIQPLSELIENASKDSILQSLDDAAADFMRRLLNNTPTPVNAPTPTSTPSRCNDWQQLPM